MKHTPLTCTPQVLHGTGILDVADLKSLDWHVLLLLGGGSALGRAIRESGLLHEVGDTIVWAMGADASPFALLSVFVVAILILTNFVSHTVASITMMPVVVEVVRCSLGKAVGQQRHTAPNVSISTSSLLRHRAVRSAVRLGHKRRLCPARLLLPKHLHLKRAIGGWSPRTVHHGLRQDRQRCSSSVFCRLCSNCVSTFIFTHTNLLKFNQI